MNKLISKRPVRQFGFTIVEIMIAMLLGLLLTGGVLQVFASSRQTYRVQEAVSRMQENGRMALEIISRDIRMTDFWGCASDVTNVVNNLDNGGGGYVDFSAGGIIGTENTGGLPGTDTLTLRGGANSGLNVQAPFGPTQSDAVNVTWPNTIEQFDTVMISDCTNADVFQVTNADPGATGTLAHLTGSGSPGNDNVTDPGCPGANAHCLSKIYGADASIYVAQEMLYAIGNGSEGEPALFRNGQEFVDGIENLQVLYGEDTNASGTPNYYVPANQVVDMLRIISIRVAVVTRSYDDNLVDGTAPAYTILGTNVVPADSRLRQVYTSTINVRNRL